MKKPNPFYLTTAWRKIRAVALVRDHYLCQYCLQEGRLTTAELVHHIKPIEMYPELALVLDNLVSLCGACHNRVHAHQESNEAVRRARVIKG